MKPVHPRRDLGKLSESLFHKAHVWALLPITFRRLRALEVKVLSMSKTPMTSALSGSVFRFPKSCEIVLIPPKLNDRAFSLAGERTALASSFIPQA